MECGKERKGELTSTGNFMDHFKKSHPLLVEKVEKYRKSVNENEPKRNQIYKKTIRDMLTSFTQDEVHVYFEKYLSQY